ncbi:MAG: GatB/YqeY domain-containing protein [Myxococcota bacterium]
MSIFEQVNQQMKDAMRGQRKLELQALRSIRAAFLLRMKEDASETVSDADCLPILRKLEKQRHESIEAFESAGRAEQAAAEQAELEVILTFLPSLADEATTRAWVEQAIAESGAKTAKDLGRVMGALMKAHKADVDGNLARKIASERLPAA